LHSASMSDVTIETSENAMPVTFVPRRNLVFFAE
jgi:7-cyano-7-deazaguanine synthase in queuosine biosynthesis